MGHRDVWGEDPLKWKKQCPCFNAEAEYANIGKINENAPKAQPELYVMDDKDHYKNILKDLRDWGK